MTPTQFIDMLTGLIPIATFGALAFSVFLFIKNKGTMDALQEAVETYRTLAEARESTIKDLEYKIEALSAKIAHLEKELEVQRRAMQVAIDETIAGFDRRG